MTRTAPVRAEAAALLLIGLASAGCGEDANDTTPPIVAPDSGQVDPLLGESQVGIGVQHDPAWVTHLGGSGEDEAISMTTSPAGIYLGGHTSSSWFRSLADVCDPNIDPDHEGEDCGDAFITNVTSGAGTQFGNPQKDEVKFLLVADDTLYACGNLREVAAAKYLKDGFIASYPLDLGSQNWHVDLANPSRVDEFMGLALSGDLFAAGGSNQAVDGHPIDQEDAVVVRITPKGETLLLEQFGDAGLDELMAAAADADGMYVTGTAGGWIDDTPGQNLGSSDSVLIAFDHDLASTCRVQFGTSGKDVGQGVIVVGDYLYLAGYTEGRINGDLPNGSSCNQDDYPPSDEITTEAFVAKYDKNCQHVWTREFGSKDSDAASTIVSDGEHLYVSGFYGSQAVAHGGTTSTTHAFVRAYDLDGNVVGEVTFDANHDIGQSVAVDSEFVYVTGGTDGVLGAGPSLGGRDAFLATIPRSSILGNVEFDGNGCE